MKKTAFFIQTLPCVAWILMTSLNVYAAESAKESSPKKEPWELSLATEVWDPVPSVISVNENAIPSDAIVLFDGKDLNQWQGAEQGSAKWRLIDNAMEVVPKTGDIKTKESFCDVQLHIEWMTPTRITASDGKILEVQVLDSYQNKTYANGQAAAIYKQSIPLVNASHAPGKWQTYDIIFTAPVFDNHKKLIKPAYITVLHNGVLVQNHFEVQGATAWIGKPVYDAHGCAPLRLQDHGNPVRFRNIWIRKLN
jgi:hypothetical protein